MAQYEQLAEFKKRHGHCYLAKEGTSRFGEERKLANWMARQRRAHVKGTLSSDRKELLDALDFYFDPNDYLWDQHFNQIKQLYDEHGHVDFPTNMKSVTDKNRVFLPHMAWAKEQRIQYLMREKNWHNVMSDRRISKLESIGFTWKPSDPGELKAVEKNASSKQIRWAMRGIPTSMWSEALGKLKAAKESGELATAEGS
jgi:hypothetical protein